MTKYRYDLPQLSDRIFLTDGGLETTLIFHDGMELPYFASFHLMNSEAGRRRLYDYFAEYATTARKAGLGFVLESATWRASPDWGARMGLTETAMADINRRSIEMLSDVRASLETNRSPMVISGNIGPRGDGYRPDQTMTAEEAEAYHAWQVGIFRNTDADMVSAFTMNTVEEAVGVARAAKAATMPVVISFTLETDGRLPTGQSLGEAIEAVDAATNAFPAYFMINCAHPTHFAGMLASDEPWVKRIRGLRANASKRSHAELDEAKDLDDGDPLELAEQYRELRTRLPHLTVLGGCCGTDHRHVAAISRSCAHARANFAA
jgi:S-methylmethionine-dependent homocysteine/selenocysteine methylase